MFCPNCGKAEQVPETYCRQCGDFLNDQESGSRRGFGGNTPQKQIRTNLVLSLMSGILSLISAIAVYIALYGEELHGKQQVLYIVAAFLLAMSGWQFSAFIVNLKLRKTFEKARQNQATENKSPEIAAQNNLNTRELLNEANFSDIVPPGVTENTTKHLGEKVPRKSSS